VFCENGEKNMNPVVANNATLLAILAELTATGNLYDGAKLMLIKSDFVIQPETVLADLDEADFHGYARSAAITWSAPFVSPTNTPVVAGDLKSFVATATFANPNSIFGWAMVDGGGTTLLVARHFETPVIITAAGQAVQVVPAVPAFLPE
jgi:hypothetical protein